MLSYRVALAFRYSTRQVFFSDRGFKAISQMQLKVIDGDHYSYNASIETVFRYVLAFLLRHLLVDSRFWLDSGGVEVSSTLNMAGGNNFTKIASDRRDYQCSEYWGGGDTRRRRRHEVKESRGKCLGVKLMLDRSDTNIEG